MFIKYLLVRPEFVRVYTIQVDSEFHEDPFVLNADVWKRRRRRKNLISLLNKNLVMYNSINTVFT